MGRRGYPARPTALKVLHGDRKDRINRQEPRPLEVPIEMPMWMTQAAQMEWERLAPHLEAMGTVKATDIMLLAAYCETVARWLMVTKLAAKSPPVFKRGETEDGQPIWVKNPLYSQARDLTSELRVLAREFGFTPSARSGLKVTVVGGAPIERLFTGSGG